MDNERGPEAAWDGFALELREHCAMWKSLADEVAESDLEAGTNLYHQMAVPRLLLIPLVEEMKNYPVLRSLYPYTSHQWLRLRSAPPARGGKESEIWAAATGDGIFRVRRFLTHRLPEWHFEPMGEGSAAEMAWLIADEEAQAQDCQ